MKLYDLIITNKYITSNKDLFEYSVRINFNYEMFMNKAVSSDEFFNNLKLQFETFDNAVNKILTEFDENNLIYIFDNKTTVWQNNVKDIIFSNKGTITTNKEINELNKIIFEIRNNLLKQEIYLKITNLVS